MKKLSSKDLTQIALSTALLAAASLLVIPIGPVPITLQVFLFLLLPALLGPRKSMMVIILYTVSGLIGLPVFAGGTGGISSVISPSFGYIIGAVPLSLFVGSALLKESSKIRTILFMCGGLFILYTIGVVYQYVVMRTVLNISITLLSIISVNLTVFLPLDFLKALLACTLYYRLKRLSFAKRIQRY